MIILEGFDGAGKSTLAKAIQKRFNLPIYHAGGKPISPLNEKYCLHVQQALTMLPIIHDRVTSISTFCYEMRRDTVQGVICLHSAMELLRVNPFSKLVYCPLPETNVSHDVKEYDTPEHLSYIESNKAAILEHYDFIFNFLKSKYPDQVIKCHAFHELSVNALLSELSNSYGS
jgi:hypothetical protein